MLRVRFHMGCYGALHNRMTQIIASHKALLVSILRVVAQCPRWVICGHRKSGSEMSALPLKADMLRAIFDVRYVPCVDGSELASQDFTSRCWSVQPCVRPVSAVRMTAGHNALRGSGPGQQPAFKDAVAHVGCPDRRIDRLCITCCSSSQPSHHAGWPARSRYAASAIGSL
jgi:hypothetical protein